MYIFSRLFFKLVTGPYPASHYSVKVKHPTTQWRQRYNHEKGRNDIVEVSVEAKLTGKRQSNSLHCTKLAQNGFLSSAIIHPKTHARTTRGDIQAMLFVITVLPPNCFAVLRRTVMLLFTIQQKIYWHIQIQQLKQQFSIVWFTFSDLWNPFNCHRKCSVTSFLRSKCEKASKNEKVVFFCKNSRFLEFW